jgi:hypothetical protein
VLLGGRGSARLAYSPFVRFELPGATIVFRGLDGRDARDMRVELDPYEPAERDGARAADVLVETVTTPSPHFEDIQNPAADGRVTASDGKRLYLLERGCACALPCFDEDLPFVFQRQPDFPLRPLLRSTVWPTLQLALLERGGVAVHGTTVDRDGAGIVVAGWSESGKTETALVFLERGASFVSDKWTVLTGDRELASFPISVGIRKWVLPHLARLRRGLPQAARIQLAFAAAAATATGPIRRGGGSRLTRLASTSAERAVTLAERAALRPSQLSRIYGTERPQLRTPLGAVVLLTTVADSGVSARTVDPTWAARRLARSASYERREFFELHRRARYSFPDISGDLESAVERREEGLLSRLLDGVALFEVKAPFPTDPRRVADAISQRL